MKQCDKVYILLSNEEISNIHTNISIPKIHGVFLNKTSAYIERDKLNNKCNISVKEFILQD